MAASLFRGNAMYQVKNVKPFDSPDGGGFNATPVSYTHLTLPTNREV